MSSENGNLLVAEKVRKEFGGLVATDDVDFTIPRGRIVSLIGPNGAGKTTFFNMLTGVYRPTSGRIIFDGEDVTGKPPHAITERGIGRTFQNIRLFQNMTALENVMCGLVEVRRLKKREARERAFEFLDRVGLRDKADQYPEELSGGQQQRVAIARALVMRPKAMLFDEPTSALDVELVREVLDVMEGLARDGMTMVVVSHELRFAHHVASSILMMDEGQVIEEAPPDRFFSSPSHERTKRFLALVE